MVVSKHSARLVLGRPAFEFHQQPVGECCWSCGCRAKGDGDTLDMQWCADHEELFARAADI